MSTQSPRSAGGVGGRTPTAVQPAGGWFNADQFQSGIRRINTFCGGFGSGKTEVAVNFSLRMRELGHRISIADLDIVNLYFRSREVREQLRGQGIDVLIPSGALADADLPIIVPEVKGAIEGQSPKPETRVTNEARSEVNHQDTKAQSGQGSGVGVQSPVSNVQRPPLVVLD